MLVDELVARRVLELDAADALEAVRTAIEADNWVLAQQLTEAAQARFAQHEWATAILATMRRLIGERDKHRARKETLYARQSLNVRLSSREEANFSYDDEAAVPAFLRRKSEQGKGRSSP